MWEVELKPEVKKEPVVETPKPEVKEAPAENQ